MPDTTGGRLETRAEAWARRRTHAGAVDFTMMYAAHDAFDRDLGRLHEAAAKGDGAGRVSAEMRATWEMFAEQLHVHHTAEDKALWPALSAAAADDGERDVLAAMEGEHAALDPMLERVDAAFSAGDADGLRDELAALRGGLGGHMAHEEEAALPLVERRLGQSGWDAFGREIRERVGGMAAGARYLPWVLDGADDQVRASILRVLPFPARVLYRRRWEPRYRAAVHL